MPQASRVIRIVRCNGCGRLKDEVTYMIPCDQIPRATIRTADYRLTLDSVVVIAEVAIELRRRGVELLSPVLVPYGFVYQAGEVDRGSGGLYAHGGSHERTVRWNSACAMRSVRSAIASMLPRYCTKTSPAPPLGADKRDTRGSLTIRSTASATSRRIWFASGLSSSPAPPRSLQRLSRKPSVPVRRAGLPRSPLAITLLGWAWAHLRTRPARNAAP